MHARLGAGLIAALLALATFGTVGVVARSSTPDLDLERRIGDLAPLPANCELPCTVTVTLTGNGGGSWQSTNSSYVPDGVIHCVLHNGSVQGGSVCSHQYGGIPRVTPVTVYYLVTPEAGSCIADGDPCDDETIMASYTLANDSQLVEAAAAFQLMAYQANVTKGGTGTGSVLSTPAGINCGSTCSASWEYGTSVQLLANPDAGSTFGGWTGACTGQQAACLIGIIGPTTTKALFNLAATDPPTPGPTKRPATTAPPPTTAPSIGRTPEPSTPTAATTSPSEPSAGPTIPPTAGPGTPTEPPAIPTVGTAGDKTFAIIIVLVGLLVMGITGFLAYRKRRRSPAAR